MGLLTRVFGADRSRSGSPRPSPTSPAKKPIALRMGKEVLTRSLETPSLDAALALERNAIQWLNNAPEIQAAFAALRQNPDALVTGSAPLTSAPTKRREPMDFSFTDEQHVIAETFERFCDKELSDAYVRWMDANVDFPPEELWDKFADAGAVRGDGPDRVRRTGPRQNGQHGHLRAVCKRSMSVALARRGHVRLRHPVPGRARHRGAEAEYLPRLAEGRLRTAMALTEPAEAPTSSARCATFAEDAGDSWVINGNKIFITGAHVADLIFTVCRTERDARRSESWSTIMVPRPSEGMTMRPVQKISCHHCGSVEISLDDVVVPKENLIGARGQAYREIMTVLNPERIAVAMLGVGDHRRDLRDAACSTSRSGTRSAALSAGSSALQHYLADMYINLENARNLTYKAAWLCDTGQPYHLEAAMAKLVAAEGARHAGTYGTEIFGGYGICTNTRYPCSRGTLTRSSSRPSPTR